MTIPALSFRCLFVVIIVATAAGRVSAAEPVTPLDLLNLRAVTAIDVARDGSVAVVAVRSVSMVEEKDGRPIYAGQSHLWLIDLLSADAEPRQLTFGKRVDGAPAISPRGKHLAFLRRTENEKDKSKPPAAQVWVLALDGGEARQITSLKHGAGGPRWSPDGGKLLTTTAVEAKELSVGPTWESERPRGWVEPDKETKPKVNGTLEEIRAWLNRSAEAGDARVIDRLSFQGEQSLRKPARYRQLVLVDIDDPSSPTVMTGAHRNHRSPRFMPDGQSIVYSTRAVTDAHPDRVIRNQIRQISIDGANDVALLDDPEWSYDSPLPSADGTVMAFSASQTDEPMYRQSQLGLSSMNASGASAPIWLTDETTFDASVRSLRWMTDRAGLAFTAGREGGVPLMTMSVGLLEPAAMVDVIDEQPVGVTAFDVGGAATVYAMTSPYNPCVVRVRDSRGDRVVMDLNEWVKDREISLPTMRWITRPDGTRIQYWLMKPAKSIIGQTYPLAVEMHGGPSAMWGPGEHTMWLEFQVLCGSGYGVMYANPRGSGGYGYEFQRGNHQNWGEGPAGDVLAAVDHALLDPWVDSNRLVVTGGSYAGYLTAWIIAHDHRFKAAVAQRGVYELTTFFGEGNAWRIVPWAFGGYPWEPETQPILRRESPFTYVQRIRTPLLIMHGSNDLRTGVSQSEMLYRALKQLGRPVEYVRYPRAGHDLSRSGDPNQRVDRLLRIVEFFERCVR